MSVIKGGYERGRPDLTDADYLAKLLATCRRTENGCLEYEGFRFKPPRHYGMMSYRGVQWRTHRLMWMLVRGPIPDGMHVLHSCDNPPCCDVEHMRLGTHLENMAECRAKGRYYYANLTHCKRGHPFNEENTYIIKTPGPAYGLRQCRVCQRGHQRLKWGWPEELAFTAPKGYQWSPSPQKTEP